MVSRESHWIPLDLALPKPNSSPPTGKSGGPMIQTLGKAMSTDMGA
ncbi:hypothetical protein COLO4_00055 [Corchorus olitorius]|uniref:Uncharacterized protein n=1 Tax=Corchorus olitorius TaxID=93759 RepID=A0A1R3L4Q6_9ROSI|nr:hypothetical protein COLO4_03879 [Corchorus olitorius]OMP11429.1 hypothetical protein COLO4_03825 [Corchorus olitorius]OMP14322.1 hypothetical protein COLO4_00055 [Corchorus olitorius]